MKLLKLLELVEYEVLNLSADIEVGNLLFDSRKVAQKDVFVCIVGAVSDGHGYIEDVAKKGASAIIVMKDIEITESLKDVCVIKTQDTRLALAYMSAAFFDYPAKKLKTIGITGTKGKTTTSFMVRDILEKCNIKTGLIGTIETIIGDEHIPSQNTTPESYLIHEYFDKMVKKGLECVVMEVSSQALKMHRTAGIEFDIGVFTNLEPDHIGPNEHDSFEEYLNCKSLLFRQCRYGIVNNDSEHIEEVLKNHTCSVERYAIHSKGDYLAGNIEYIHKGGQITTRYEISGKINKKVNLYMPGEFSVYNSLCAIAVASHFNIDDEKLDAALLETKVAGRVETVNVSDDYIIMIDYAHNAMALKSLLETLREYNPGRIVCIFGCGGNRSKLRRFEMGEVSGNLADFTIITSDNPRFEKPTDIMKDIETGIKKTTGNYVMIENRKEAIKYAMDNSRPGDMIVVAGKGHEDYQEIEGVKYHQTDKELILQVKDGI